MPGLVVARRKGDVRAMAKKVTVTLVDDMDEESVADETVEFGLDGQGYEMDLSSANAERFREQMKPWMTKARKVGRATPRRARGSKERYAAVRQWARARGHKIGDRGRVPASLIAAYDAENG